MKIAELFEQEYSADDLAKSEKAYRYARYVLKGPFPAGEAAIAKSAHWSCRYAEFVLKKPFPAGEAAIAKDAWRSYEYARDVLKRKPFKAGEAAIATENILSYNYAKDVLKGPWPAGEAVIATSAEYSYLYARYAIKGPWSAGEAVIATSNRCKPLYVNFLKSISANIDTFLLDLIQQKLDDGEKIYLDFMEGELVQKGLITKIYKNIVYAKTDLGFWFVQEDVDEHFTLRKIANQLVVQKV